MEDEEFDGGKKWYYILLTVTFVMIAASIVLTGFMYKFFSKPGCGTNTFFITFNLILGFFYCMLSLHPKVRETRPTSGLLQGTVVFLYSTYLIWSALLSEPSGKCNYFSSFSDGSKAFSLIMGAVFTIISVVLCHC